MRVIKLEEYDILYIFREKRLKTKIGTFKFNTEQLKELKRLCKKSKYYARTIK